jgi:hypothetical protein
MEIKGMLNKVVTSAAKTAVARSATRYATSGLSAKVWLDEISSLFAAN